MSAEDTATFSLLIEGNAAEAGREIAASALDSARALAKWDDEAKALRAQLRALRGSSEEVVAARKALNNQIDTAVTESNRLRLKMHQEGVSYAAAKKLVNDYAKAQQEAAVAAAAAQKKAREVAQKRVSDAREKLKAGGGLGGNVLALKDRSKERIKQFQELSKATGSSRAAMRSMAAEAHLGTRALNLAGAAVSAYAAAAAAAVVGIAAGAAALTAFTLKASDAAAQMQRQRQALFGNAEDARNMGAQISALAAAVPQGVEELNQLSLSLAKTRLSGRAMVDTMHAVAQAAGAVDASAGQRLQDIVTRGDRFGRMRLGREELQGTGLAFDNVAAEYAALTKKSVAAAAKELRAGRVPIEQGALALRKAAEKQFGALNKANAFSLQNAPKKFGDALRELASGVDLSPLTGAFGELFEQLKPDAPLGAAIKTLMSSLGNGFVYVATKGIPAVTEGFKWLMVGALRLSTKFYETKAAIKEAFKADNWISMGAQIVSGLVKGLLGAQMDVYKTIGELAANVAKSFAEKLQIRSPSRLFAEFGEHTTEGYARGVERSAPRAQAAVEGMADAAVLGARSTGAAPAAAAPAASSAPQHIEIHFHNAPLDNTAALTSPSFLAQITHAVRAARTANALPSPA